MHSRPIVAIVVVFAIFATGCRTASIFNVWSSKPPAAAVVADDDPHRNEDSTSSVRTVSAQMGQAATQLASQATSPANSADAAYTQAMRELDALGSEDPVARDQLWKQLQTVKPSLWPLAIEQFKSARGVSRELNQTMPPPPSVPVSYPSTETIPPPAPQQPSDPHGPAQPAVTAVPNPELSPLGTSIVAKPIEPLVEAAPIQSWQEVRQQVLQSGYETPSTLWPAPAPITQVAAALAPPQSQLQSVPATLPAYSAVPAAAARLSDGPNEGPNTGPNYEARMRMAELLAGDRSAATRPIPGLASTEQQLWSQQLLAMQNMLDNHTPATAPAGVTAATQPLHDDSNEPSELAELKVQGLAFCTKVYGFGDFDAIASSKFRAGQAIALYVEVANYRSELTQGRYHTSIGSSYEIVNAAGKRIDEGEFAVVNDSCRSRRSDFYIEYSLSLPQRMPAGKYKLVLTMDDRLADKSGTQTIDFEVVDAAGRR